MAEVHIVGQVVGGSDFSNNNLFCRWGIVTGNGWDKIEGYDRGQTQVDWPEDHEFAVWSHPVDVHFSTKGLSDWPRFYVQVFSQDQYGRNDLDHGKASSDLPAGYGSVHVPMAPGMYELECPTWRPQGSLMEEVSAFFLGGHPQLRNEDLVVSPADRSVEPTGYQHILSGITGDFF